MEALVTHGREARPPAHQILLDHAERDLDEGLAFVRQRMRESAKGPFAFVARGLETAVLAGLAALELRPRLREDVGFLLDLCAQVDAGADPRKLADDHLARVLRLRELNLVVKVKDPAFQPILDLCRDAFAARLPDLARMARVPEPRDYDDLLVRAFPEREEPERIVRANHALMLDIVAHVERNPGILRIPDAMVPRVVELSREVTEWKTREVLRGLDEAYGPANPTPT